jgi:uncharacterized protein (TIGR02118 family)
MIGDTQGANMIKVSVLYPNSEAATFDMDYYCNTHMPLVKRLLGEALKGLSADQGVATPDSPAPYIAMGHLLFESLGDFQAAMATHGPALMADIPNYTNARPTIQVSEVKM